MFAQCMAQNHECSDNVIPVTLKHVINVYMEQFSNDCRKTNTEVNTPINHNRRKQHDEPVGIP